MKRTILILFLFSVLLAAAQDIEIYFSGKTYGEITPCSCPVHPDGGISRRIKFLTDRKSPDTLFIDTGGILSGGYGESREEHIAAERDEVLIDGYKRIGYDAISPGVSEFTHSSEYIRKLSEGLGKILVCTNYTGKTGYLNKYIVKQIGDTRVLIFGVFIPDENFPVHEDFPRKDFADPAESVKNELINIRRPDDLVIVIGSISEDQARKLAGLLPNVHIILFGKNEILQKEPEQVKKTYLAASNYQSKKIGRLLCQFRNGKPIDIKCGFTRMSPATGEIADIYIRSLQVCRQESVKCPHYVYFYLGPDYLKYEKKIKESLKVLLKKGIERKVIFSDFKDEDAIYFDMMNNELSKYIKIRPSKMKQKEYKAEMSRTKNEHEKANFGTALPGVYTGLRYFSLEDLDTDSLIWDMRVLGLLK